jgi:FkbM family methyltransferase
MGKLTAAEQLDGLYLALKYVTDWSLAIDGGAHGGDWTAVMASRFKKVIAFEPAPDMFAQLLRRFRNNKAIQLEERALWYRRERVSVVEVPKRQGLTRSRIVRAGGDIKAEMIDQLGLGSCGLIKLDVEGAELICLQGAVRTLLKFRPVVIVECDKAGQFGSTLDDPGEFLTVLGAKERERHGVDRIYSWK